MTNLPALMRCLQRRRQNAHAARFGQVDAARWPPYAACMADPISYADFEKLDIRVGTVVDARAFPEARKPALQLWIDFGGDVGVKKSSAQITVHYKPDQLIGRQVLAVVNFSPRQIGPFVSEVLTLGLPGDEGEVVLAKPDFKVPDGGRLY
jgi:tRNA-binding protein